METIEEFETFVRDRVVALHMGLPQKISARKLSYAIGQSAGYINKIETGQSLPPSAGFIISANTSALHPKSFSTMDSGPLKNSGISWMNWYS